MSDCGHDEFNTLCDRFESIWNFETSGAASIRQFLETCAGGLLPDSDELSRLVSELVQIDIERWWMSWQQKVESSVAQATPAEILELFNQRATLENYLELLPHAPSNTAFWQKLAECEVNARDRWGDKISGAYFKHRFGVTLLAGLGERTLSSYPSNPKIFAIRDGVHRASENSASRLPVCGLTLFGRQQPFDAADWMVQELAHGNRIVIAGREESTISREQLSLQLLTPDFAILTNLSKVNPFIILPNRILATGQSVFVRFPTAVKLTGRTICCYQIPAK